MPAIIYKSWFVSLKTRKTETIYLYLKLEMHFRITLFLYSSRISILVLACLLSKKGDYRSAFLVMLDPLLIRNFRNFCQGVTRTTLIFFLMIGFLLWQSGNRTSYHHSLPPFTYLLAICNSASTALEALLLINLLCHNWMLNA